MANPLTATRFFVITPGPNPIVGPMGASGRVINRCDGFVANVDGTMDIVGAGDGGAAGVVTIAVKAGVRYDFSLRFVLAATGPTSIVGFLE